MKQVCGTILAKMFAKALAILILLSGPAWSNSDYSLVLIGGGLEFCSSNDPRQCQKALNVDSDTLVDFLYQLDNTRLDSIRQAPWLTGREKIKEQVFLTLIQVARTTRGAMTYRQLLNAFRKTEIVHSGTKVTGSELLRSLHDKEFLMILDWLQIPAIEKGFLSGEERKKIKLDLNRSKSEFSVRVLREFVRQAQQQGRGSKTEIAFVTAGNRDAFAEVDVYQQVFEQFGVQAVWLPMDAALLYAMQENQGTKDNPYCSKLEVYRQQELFSFRRNAIYPDLAARQTQLCQEPKALIQILNRVQGLFFADGDPTLIRRAFIHKDGKESDALSAIKRRFHRQELVVAADGGAIHAMTGSARDNGVVMLEGRSHQALSFGSLASESSLTGCEKLSACPSNYVKDGLVYQFKGGLGFFPQGIIDSQLSERARQGRLIRLLADTKLRYGFGVDERTALLIDARSNGEIGLRMEVAGESGVSIFDSEEVMPADSFRRDIRSIKYHSITHGDRIFFRGNKLVVSFADWKYSSNKLTRPVIQSGNAFNGDNFRRTMNMLCSTGAENATLKHSVVGKGHVMYVQKSRTSISLAGSRNVRGKNYGYCSFRDYYLDITPL